MYHIPIFDLKFFLLVFQNFYKKSQQTFFFTPNAFPQVFFPLVTCFTLTSKFSFFYVYFYFIFFHIFILLLRSQENSISSHQRDEMKGNMRKLIEK